jgi:hypothetical protein
MDENFSSNFGLKKLNKQNENKNKRMKTLDENLQFR